MIYDFSHMFICLLWFCHRLLKGEIVRMCLILQKIRFQVQVLKPCKSVQETSEEVLDFKV